MLSGTEFNAGGGNFTQSEVLALLLGVNRDENCQLWVADSTVITQNTSYGDNFLTSYWGISPLLNLRGSTDGNGSGNN